MVWRGLSQFFGSRWVRQYGNEPLETWAWGLRDLTFGEIKHGLDAVRTSGQGWPPTLPEFRDLCRPSDPILALQLQEEAKPLRLESDAEKAARRERAAREVRLWRSILGKGDARDAEECGA